MDQTQFPVFSEFKEKSLYRRYITNRHIEPLLLQLGDRFQVNIEEYSVLDVPIYSVKVGTGPIKVLLWSQMHGNESTTTKSLFDVFKVLASQLEFADTLLSNCTLYIVPILNPDGAKAYTRLNANEVDLNRDSKELSQPESALLRRLFDEFKPDYCFNLHGQRTIFSAGKSNKPATVSFLSPAEDEERTVTATRQKAMDIIGEMNKYLQDYIPNQVGVYDDTFNINCVGDMFQSLGVPTVLFEAGHYYDDYVREKTREYIFISMLSGLHYIATKPQIGNDFERYFDIPQNEKLFYDVIIRNALVEKDGEWINNDIAIQFREILLEERIEFVPKIEKIGGLNEYFGHKEINASNIKVLTHNYKSVFEGYENDFVVIGNEEKVLKTL
ncbi:M14 family metallopeptidase [Mangrovimonas aestuarii]|uniref:M14 family metallopeptidase n=1 Tax=Mangrovimonas aestuarii TaxID=3018443 RepID=UPI002377E5E6|nr:M14 metallopeptidase family protein [Mangrovimonas aestuarii]